MAAELASKQNEATTKVWFLVSTLQEYFLTRPYMRVALHGDSDSKVRPFHCHPLPPPRCADPQPLSLHAHVPGANGPQSLETRLRR